MKILSFILASLVMLALIGALIIKELYFRSKVVFRIKTKSIPGQAYGHQWFVEYKYSLFPGWHQYGKGHFDYTQALKEMKQAEHQQKTLNR